MNPNTYKKRGVDSGSAQNPQVGVSSKKGSWLNEIVNAKLSSAIAFAFIIFAAGTVAGLTSTVASESAISDSLSSMTNTLVHKKPLHAPARVLGESITQTVIDDSALEAGDASGIISAKPISFDATAQRWDYNINYSVANSSNPATLTIGSYVVQSNIVSSGTVETGAILKPSMTYNLSLWVTDAGGYKQILAHYELKTQKAEQPLKLKTAPVPPVCLNSASTTSSSVVTPNFCIKKDDGSIQCVPRPCVPGTASPDSSSNNNSTSTVPVRPPIIIKGILAPAQAH